VLYSVLRMDAGPLLRQVNRPLQGHEKTPELLESLFRLGTEELLTALPGVFDGSLVQWMQDESQATPAPKLSSNDSFLDFSILSAEQCHNRCRGYSGWPGTWTYLRIGDSPDPVRVKILTTRVLIASGEGSEPELSDRVEVGKDGITDVLRVRCRDGGVLGVLEVQPANKKEMSVKAYLNGLRGADIRWLPAPPQ
jgi:methionyl-tRNA formyltransferase